MKSKNGNKINTQIDKRNLLSSFFITLLIGIAFQEMINAVKNPIMVYGVSVNNSFLGLTFFFVSIRFFIGNQLHLFNKSLLKLSGLLWLYDLMVIIVQSAILIFLGTLCTVDSNINKTLGFVEFLAILFAIDVSWIISQYVMGKIVKEWKRESIPWIWAKLNSVLLLFILTINYLVDNIYSEFGLIVLFTINLVAFIVDVILIDYYDAI